MLNQSDRFRVDTTERNGAVYFVRAVRVTAPSVEAQ